MLPSLRVHGLINNCFFGKIYRWSSKIKIFFSLLLYNYITSVSSVYVIFSKYNRAVFYMKYNTPKFIARK